ncbi:hypothetical protein QFC19_007997 [Naganishia cerealis]|uniref:Uncharacterized protein n=1 Tax=Naganishia cerealis TaxID=610337 RepID=A0ACC2V4X6_9TREE|nr:hypothetical protein QFC19_007997 [Naganishia cerealis]
MSRNTRGTRDTARQPATRARVAPASRTVATRTTRKATQQEAEAGGDTAVNTVAKDARKGLVEDGLRNETKRATASTSVTKTKPAVSRTVAKKPISGETEAQDKSNEREGTSRNATRKKPTTSSSLTTTIKQSTSRVVRPSTVPIVEDALSLTKDFQAILRSSIPATPASEQVSSTPCAPRSTEENELDVLGRYLSRSLRIADNQGANRKSMTKPSNRDLPLGRTTAKGKETASQILLDTQKDASDGPSQGSERFIAEKKHEINLAKHVINAGLRTLLNVYHSGYRKAATIPSASSTPGGQKTTWTDEDVMKTVNACWQAFKTIDRLQPETETSIQTMNKNILDGQNADDKLGKEDASVSKVVPGDEASIHHETPQGKKTTTLQMERMRVVLISRCWMLGLYTKSLDILAESQRRVLDMYEHEASRPTSGTMSNDPRSTGKEKPSDGRSRNAKVPERTRKLVVAKTQGPQPLLDGWIELLDLPLPLSTNVNSPESADDAVKKELMQRVKTMDPDLKSVLMGRLIAAWISVSGLCLVGTDAERYISSEAERPLIILYSKVFLAYLERSWNTCQSGKISILALAMDAPETAITQHIFQVCVIFNKAEASLPQLRPFIPLQMLKASILAICAGEDIEGDRKPLITYGKLWLTLRVIAERCITGAANESLALRRLDKTVREVVQSFQESHTQATQEKGMSGEEWLALLELWQDLGRSLNDLDIVEEASRLLQATNSGRKEVNLAAQDLEKKMSSLTLGREEVCTRIVKITATFTHLAALLETVPNTLKALVALQAMPKHLQDFLDTYGLLDGEPYTEAVVKITRAIRSIQHRLQKVAMNDDSPEDSEVQGWDAAMKEWLSSLISCISCVLINKSTMPVPAIPFIEGSVNIAKKMLDSPKARADLKPETLQLLDELTLQLSKRLQLLATCHIKKGDKMNGLAVYLECIAAQPNPIIKETVRSAGNLSPLEVINASSPIAVVLNRLASFLQSEALFFNNSWSQVQEYLDAPTLANGYGGVSLEYILDTLAQASHRMEVSALMANICNSLITIYTSEDYPIRRLRVQIRLMEIVVDTGVGDWDFSKAESLLAGSSEIAENSLGNDQNLVKYKSQLTAQGHLHIAQAVCHAPRISSETPLIVLDNPLKLDLQLESLYNNLGMFSHGIQRIEVLRLRRGIQRQAPQLKGAYYVTTSKLAMEYTRLGKHARAGAMFSRIQEAMQKTEVRRSLSDKDISAITASVYQKEQARQQCQQLEEKKGSSTTAKIRNKSSAMSLAATANTLLSEIAMLKNDIASATRFGAVAFRLWNAAVENLARVAVKRTSNRKSQLIVDDPFSASTTKVDPQDVKALDEQISKRTMAHQTSEIRMAQIHLTKGSAKQSEAYAAQAYDLAKQLKSSTWIAITSCMLAAVHIKMNSLEKALEHLTEAKDILEEKNSPESAVCALWLNRLYMKNLQEEEAEEAFHSLMAIIGNVEKSLLEVGSVASTPIKQLTRIKIDQAVSMDDDLALSTIHKQGVRQRVLDHFKTDLFLNSLTESSKLACSVTPMHCVDYGGSKLLGISMPVGAYTLKEAESKTPQSMSTMVSVLTDAETQTGNVEDVREAVMSLALLKIYQSSLGQNLSHLTFETVQLLDSSCALTLNREMLEVIDAKRFGKANEMIWPSISVQHNGSACMNDRQKSPSDSVVFSNSWESVEDQDKQQTFLQAQWDRFTKSDVNACKSLTEQLPDGWCVVTINLTDDQNTLFISRQQAAREPIVFAVALNRQSKKEEDEDGFTFETAIGELRDIIQSSDDTARNAKHIDSREGRLEWWNTRKALDKRLESLLKEIEFSWLGAFKTILNRVDGRSPASLSTFRTALEKLFRNALASQDRTKVLHQIRLEETIIECFSTLSSKSDEQELEDLVYYILDLYQYNGIPVAVAELETEQLVLDVQSALATFESDRRTESVSPQPEEHIFLILDRHVQEIPWESIPILRGRAISRIPSARFLVDRLETQELRTNAEDGTAHKKSIDAGNTSFILNAGGDLKQTQERFGGWLGDMTKARGWKGIIDRHPTELELGAMLERSELLLYVG